MNEINPTSKNRQPLLLPVFLNSLYYTFPIAMFLTACNFLFESVKRFYFDWTVVLLPTIVVFVMGNLYEMFLMYNAKKGMFTNRNETLELNKSERLASNTPLSDI